MLVSILNDDLWQSQDEHNTGLDHTREIHRPKSLNVGSRTS